jgi:hypothetical protein
MDNNSLFKVSESTFYEIGLVIQNWLNMFTNIIKHVDITSEKVQRETCQHPWKWSHLQAIEKINGYNFSFCHNKEK